RPRHCGMAGVALEIRDDMIRRLAPSLRAVVAHRGAAARLGVIEVDRRLPGDGRVARIALVRRHDVVDRLGAGANLGADAVTRGADLRRALEDGVDVARLAR